jgi:hypothetical protein
MVLVHYIVQHLDVSNSVEDPGSGAFWTLDPESGLEKIRIRDKYSGSFSKSLLTIFLVQIPKLFVADPDPGSRVEKFRSGTWDKPG